MNNAFDHLLKLAGAWEGVYRIQVTPNDPIHESPTRLVVTPVLRGTFLRIDQTWSWQDQPQEGSLLIGGDGKSDAATIHWIDTWHNGRGAMPLTGAFAADGSLVARGHFAVKDGPDWGWRIEIRLIQDRLHIDMFCVNPDADRDEGWVRAEYRRD